MRTAASQLKGWNSSAHYLKLTGLSLLVALTCTACGSAPKTRYYTLRIPPPPSVRSHKTDFILQVERFEAPDVFRDNRIIYYTSPTQLNFYQYHRWSSDPGELLSELAMKYFAETALFRQVYAYPAPVSANFTLRGRVLDLAELEYQKGDLGKRGRGKVGLKLDLIRTDGNGNKLIWSARLEETEPIEKKKARGVVDALNVAAEHLMQRAYAGVSQVVEREYAQEQKHAH